MQAITTRFVGPTNHKGSRIIARAQAGRLVYSWDHRLNSEQNHDRAALALAQKLGWTGDYYGELIGGGLPDGKGNCYVFTKGAR